MRHWLALVAGAAVAGLVVVLLLTHSGDTGIPVWTGTCINSAGVTNTWAAGSGSPGFAGPGSSSASAAAPARSKTDQQATYPSPDPNTPALGAIADGVDPVDAARFFGTVFLPGSITTAQRAAAQDPATYGWHCSH